MLSKEIAEVLVSTIETAVERAGFGNVFEFAGILSKLIEKNARFLEAMRSRESLLKLFEELPDEAVQQLPKMMAFFEHSPSITAAELVEMSHMISKENPRKVFPGRPQVIAEDAKRDIRDEVLKLIGRGMQISPAQERVAQMRGVSKSSVERVWRQRSTLEAAPPKTLKDLLSLFQQFKS